MARTTHSQGVWDAERLLAPLDPGSFLAEYWRRSCLHLTGKASDFYQELLTRRHLEELLATDAFFAAVSVQTPSTSDSGSVTPPCSWAEVQRDLAGGASLRLRHLEAWFDSGTPLGALVRDVESRLSTELESLTCYLAPVTSTGLGPHHDETEIVTLQVEGRKRWTFFGMGDPGSPARYAPDSLPAPVHEFVLEPGDLLYMPRGLIHEVRTLQDSLSLTLVFR